METVKKTMMEKGYTTKGWINAEETNMIHAINPHGNHVVISLNKPSYREKSHYFLISNDETVPREIVDDFLTIFGDLTGICILCDQGMCIVEEDSVLHYSHNQENMVPQLERQKGRVNAYPVITYEEVMDKSAEILGNTEEVYARLLNNSIRYSVETMENLHDSINVFNDTARNVFAKTHESVAHLKSSTQQLRDEILSEAKNSPGSDKHEDLKKKMLQRQVFLAELTKFYTLVDAGVKMIDKMSAEVGEGLKNVNQEYISLN